MNLMNYFKSDLDRIKDGLHVNETFKRKIGITEETEKIKRYLMQVLKYITFVTCIYRLNDVKRNMEIRYLNKIFQKLLMEQIQNYHFMMEVNVTKIKWIWNWIWIKI